MSRCPFLIFEEPDSSDRTQGKFYCKHSEDRLSRDTLSHLCSCSYEDKFLKCPIYYDKKDNE